MRVAAILLFLSSTAWATKDQPVLLPVPTTQLKLPEFQPEEKTKPALEIAYSSWQPQSFSRPTYGGINASPFRIGAYPQLSVSFLRAIDPTGFYAKVGIHSAHLRREATLSPAPGLHYQASQNLTLLGLRLGVEFQTPPLLQDWLVYYTGISLLPTLALASQSPLEGNVSQIGVPMELSMGLLARPHFLRNFWGLENGNFGLGLHYLFGTIDDSRLNDLGAQSFFRVDW